MKPITILLLTIFLITLGSNTAFAAETQTEGTYDQGVFGRTIDKTEKPGMMERTLADIIISPANYVLRGIGMQDVVLLVFGQNPNPTADEFLQGDCMGKVDCREGMYLGVFSEGMMSAIDVLYSLFEHFLPYPLFFSLVLIGFLILFHGMSAQARTDSKAYLLAFFVALLAIRFGYYIWLFCAWISSNISKIIWFGMQSLGVKPNFFLNMVWGAGEQGYESMLSFGGLVTALVVLASVIMTGVLNYQYTIRSIFLAVLIVAFPICCVLSIFPKFRHSLTLWFQEFISHISLPVAHSIALGLFFMLLHFSSQDISVWVIVAYFFGLPSISGMVRQLIGFQGEKGIMGALSGAAGINTAKNMFRMFQSNQNHNMHKMPAAKAKGGQPNGPSGATSVPVNSKGGSGASRGANGARGMFGRAAGFGLKGAGLIVGGAVGTMAGSPMVGAMIGKGVGAGAYNISKWGSEQASQASNWIKQKWSNDRIQSRKESSESNSHEHYTEWSPGENQNARSESGRYNYDL